MTDQYAHLTEVERELLKLAEAPQSALEQMGAEVLIPLLAEVSRLRGALEDKSKMIQAQANLRADLQRRADLYEQMRELIDAADATPYELQGPEVCAIADAINDGRPYIDNGTFMEAARDALNRLAKAGLIVIPCAALSPTPAAPKE